MGRWGNGKTWTEDEDNFIKRNYGRMSAGEISRDSNMNDRTRNAVVGRAHRLGVTGDLSNRASNKTTVSRPRSAATVTGGAVTKIGLARTSQHERTAGMGMFKQVEIVEIPLDLSHVKCEPVSLADLKKHHCRWPLDGGMYCGLKRWDDNPYGKTPYCIGHHRAGHKSVAEHHRLTARR